ncbi:ribonuclease HII [Cellulomonas hominis]|uniref:ribonuclease HII n=1 Tax=Cellulomonas hominis TaxID=156981 RepID=UPI001BA316BC|nr:ribonuclease HII [Cellulomonas hominis]VTR77075.1 Ribonuclease HII [Cellulomonas hominis]
MTLLDDAPQSAPVGPVRAPARPSAPRPVPHLRHERGLLRDGALLVAGMDEVGRGSLAGPVSVGVVVIDARTRSCPRGVADSKLLTPAARAALVPALSRWGVARAVGHASAEEIDAVGIIAALRLAGRRALAAAAEVAGPVDAVVLDGSHDWLSQPAQGELFEAEPDPALALAGEPRVHLRVKADRSCATVAAASVLAKCERDGLMVDLAAQHPEYRWDSNKGYASDEHVAALRTLGPSPWHRRSWRLPLGAEPAVGAEA